MLAAFLLLIKKELWTRELNFNFQVHHATFGLFEIYILSNTTYIAAGFNDMHDYKHFQQQQKKCRACRHQHIIRFKQYFSSFFLENMPTLIILRYDSFY